MIKLKAVFPWIALVALTVIGCGHDASPRVAASNSEVGNGGHGIRVGGKLYLYDLWEAGLEAKSSLGAPIGDGGQRYLAFAKHHAARAFGDDRPLVEGLSKRLLQVHAVDPVLSLAIVESIGAYSWAFTDAELRPLSLPQPVHRVEAGQIFLLANRVGRFIYLNRNGWNEMDPWNRVSLVLHEAIYSLLPPETVQLSEKETVLRQNGRRARELVAILSGARPERDVQDRLSDFVAEGELPFQEPTWMRHRITSTFFLRYDNAYRSNLTPGRLALIGSAEYWIEAKGRNREAAFTISFLPLASDQEKDIVLLKDVCTALAEDDQQNYRISLRFTAPLELRFATYQENGELKQYIRHRRSPEAITQYVAGGSSEVFLRIATNLHNGDKTLERMIKGTLEVPPKEKVVASCQRYLSGVVGRRYFFYAALFPDPRDRYGH